MIAVMVGNSTTTHNELVPVLLAILPYIFGVIEVFGIFGNALTIFVLYGRERRFKTNYYFLVFHLAVCDLVLLTIQAVTNITASIMAYNHISSSQLHFLLGVLFLFAGYFANCEAYLLTSIAILRYRAVVYPFRTPFSRTKMNFVVLAAYGTPIVVLTPLAYFASQGEVVSLIGTKHSLTLFIYECVAFFFYLLAPMVLLGFLYSAMCIALFRHRQLIAQTRSRHDDVVTARFANAKQARNRKLVLSSVVVVTLFAVGLFPYLLLQLVSNGGIEVNPLHIYWSGLLYMLCTCAINPLVYGFTDKTLCTAYKQSIRKLFNFNRHE